ncbi:Na+-dependent transporter [Bradyrhizobium sp. U87765 SZCCT0131]|uniref:Na+-dependent transporter n=1 Tax=unclassified Bradyrhizobium TaxID=2631580 RepID=UPI001BA91BF1|nr:MULTISPECIES: Na+-dependent transporter [unclassified Bradyrhizobium]MBR1220813.1 Na+-dependent transporter [Bradyrhizobium sp. U87765 SZCCT0131]MBR1260367.1 Na+-dependent transporter [Bradyrhizobium sp. U87765 SZCCT0134]MBR1307384.1 Na+-dependent transporter [Bradyrhizobium sp. U87765 SZCCT0110]MBR1321338.1 Na+-dependent transporter [Bradyrhizobium sp. U87765 SZCCT0109]MBR1349651.1 Na+-dependent transporter [Bradyrhizobium sp. U87765 SZCCT0048]
MPSVISVVVAPPVALLAWIGRQGVWALAVIVLIGVVCPPLGTVLKPYVSEAIFILLCISFMRVDGAALRGYLRRPGLIVTATLWNAIGVPLIAGQVSVLIGLNVRAPDLFLGLMLQMVASPMMAAPALATLMGLDATLVLVTLVTCTALLPLTAPVFAVVFLGEALKLSPVLLGVKLAALLGGSLLAAAVLRRLVGAAAIQRHREPIDGVNIVALLVVVAGMMETVAAEWLAAPAHMLLLSVLVFAVFLVLLATTVVVFRRAGRDVALALGVMACQRNMGLMLAAAGGMLPAATWLYFALSQFPIYLSPLLLRPLIGARREPDAPAETIPRGS